MKQDSDSLSDVLILDTQPSSQIHLAELDIPFSKRKISFIQRLITLDAIVAGHRTPIPVCYNYLEATTLKNRIKLSVLKFNLKMTERITRSLDKSYKIPTPSIETIRLSPETIDEIRDMREFLSSFEDDPKD